MVIAAVGDGASSNKRFFTMHAGISGNSDVAVTYRTTNLHPEIVYFILASGNPSPD